MNWLRTTCVMLITSVLFLTGVYAKSNSDIPRRVNAVRKSIKNKSEAYKQTLNISSGMHDHADWVNWPNWAKWNNWRNWNNWNNWANWGNWGNWGNF